MMKNQKRGPMAVCALAAALAAGPAAAVDGISFIGGTGDDAKMGAIGLVWNWDKQWFKSGDWSLGGYWEADASYWKGDDPGGNSIGGIGFTPVFRYGSDSGSLAPYVEAGIGVHLFSSVRINDTKKMGTAFEFGDHVGFGFRFGEGLKYDLGYRYQHYSNAGISDNNGGINFHQIRLKYGF